MSATEGGEYKERRTDTRTRGRIVELEVRYAAVAKKLTIMVGVIGVTLVVLTAIVIGLIRENANRSRQIQQERANATMTNCLAQNDRHDQALGRLNRTLPPNPRAGGDETSLRLFVGGLIDALAQHRDCAKVVKQSVKSVK